LKIEFNHILPVRKHQEVLGTLLDQGRTFKEQHTTKKEFGEGQ